MKDTQGERKREVTGILLREEAKGLAGRATIQETILKNKRNKSPRGYETEGVTGRSYSNRWEELGRRKEEG